MTQPEGQTLLWFTAGKKILLWGSGTWLTPFRRRYMGLPWQQRDFLPMPIRQLQHSICGHLKRTAPPQVIPEKSPPTLNEYLDAWTVPLCRLWCHSVKNTLLINFPSHCRLFAKVVQRHSHRFITYWNCVGQVGRPRVHVRAFKCIKQMTP